MSALEEILKDLTIRDWEFPLYYEWIVLYLPAISCRGVVYWTVTLFVVLVAVVIGFFICWAPFHAQRLLYVYAKDSPNYREINEKMFFVTGKLFLPG